MDGQQATVPSTTRTSEGCLGLKPFGGPRGGKLGKEEKEN